MQIGCRLGYLIVLISNGICQYERRYTVLNKNICHFLGPSPSAISGKKIQIMGTYTKWCNAVLWIFSAKRARWWSRVLDLFQDSRIRVKHNAINCRYSMTHSYLDYAKFSTILNVTSRPNPKIFEESKGSEWWVVISYDLCWLSRNGCRMERDVSYFLSR